MANTNKGVNYESGWLNADQELVVEKLTEAIEKLGRPNLADMKGEQGRQFKSYDDFLDYWKGVFPNIADNITVEKTYRESKFWGSLNGLSVLKAGISDLLKKEKGFSEIDDFAQKVLQVEASAIGRGDQKFVAERDEI